MKINPDTSIGEIAVGLDGAVELFEENRINYFFGGHLNLKTACDQAGVALEGILESLEKLQRPQTGSRDLDWRHKPLREIINHIVRRQHVFIRLRLINFRKRASDLARSGNPWNPIFSQLNDLIQDMAQQMEEHMKIEEDVVFPYLNAMEQARSEKGGQPGAPLPSGSRQHILASLSWKHEAMWDKWVLLRKLTGEFHPPENENKDFEGLCGSFKEFEDYIHQHGHLEDNILFRRAVEEGFLS